jgi:hypothetical protein
MKNLSILFTLLFSSLTSLAQDYSACLETFKAISKSEREFKDFKCAPKELFFGDKKIPSLSCTNSKNVFSEPVKIDGGHKQEVVSNGQKLTVFYSDNGFVSRIESRGDQNFDGDFFAKSIDFNYVAENCYAKRLYRGTPSKFRNIEFDTDACADWVKYNEKFPQIHQCLGDIDKVEELYSKHFKNDFTKGSTFLGSSVSELRKYMGRLDENCRSAEMQWGSKKSIEAALKKWESENTSPEVSPNLPRPGVKLE